MPRISPQTPFCLSLLLALATVGLPAAAARAERLRGSAADPVEAQAAGLTREWIVQLPFQSDGYRLDRVDVGRWLVVAQSGDGMVHAVQAAAFPRAAAGAPAVGTLLWSTSLGVPRAPIFPAGIDHDLVAVARDMDCYGLDVRTGSLFWQRRLPAPPSAGSLPVGDWVYTPLHDASVYRLPANPYRQPKQAEPKDGDTPANRSKVVQVSLDPVRINSHGIVEQLPDPYAGGAIWCTRNGHLTAIEPADKGWARHEFHLRQQPNGPIMVVDQTIFAATITGELARFEDAPGGLRLSWRTLLETSLHANQPQPQLMLKDKTLIVSLGEAGIAAHDAETGKRITYEDATGQRHLWHSPLEATLLAIVGDNLWCYDRVNRLTALRLTDGKPVAFLNPGPFTVPVVNRATERLVLASPRGLLASLAPLQLAAAAAPANATEDAAATSEPATGEPGTAETDSDADGSFSF